QDPLTDRHPRQHRINEERCGLRHPAPTAARAKAAAFAAEGHEMGSTFTVVLPSGLPDEAEEAAPEAESKPRIRASERLAGLTVLVVEDETDTLEFFARFLVGQVAPGP